MGEGDSLHAPTILLYRKELHYLLYWKLVGPRDDLEAVKM
jgi:hypothetical protein